MSVGALTTLAAARDRRPPRKQDVGKATGDKAEDPASLTDILVTQVPTELVAPYTVVTAAIVGAVVKPTKAIPNPDQLANWRWLAFAILIVATVVLIWEGKRRKSPDPRFPWLEVTGGVAAATGWAFALPGSPLIPYVHGISKTLLPLTVAFAAVAFTAMTASALQAPRRLGRAKAGPGGSPRPGGSPAPAEGGQVSTGGSTPGQALVKGTGSQPASAPSGAPATRDSGSTNTIDNREGGEDIDKAGYVGRASRRKRVQGLENYHKWRNVILVILIPPFVAAVYFFVRQVFYPAQSATEWFAGDTVALGLLAVVAAFATAAFAYPTFLDWRDQMIGPHPTVEVRYGMPDGVSFDELIEGTKLTQNEATKTFPTLQFIVHNDSRIALHDGRLSIFVQSANGEKKVPYVTPMPKDNKVTKFETVSHVYWREDPKVPARLLSTQCYCPPRDISYLEESFKFPETELNLRIVLTGSNVREPWSNRYTVQVSQ
jgi:hypothetical protein